MRKIILGFLFFIMMIPCLVHADAFINIQNDSGKTVLCSVYHVDHDRQDTYPYPINIMGAELVAGKSFDGDFKHCVGVYFIMVLTLNGQEKHRNVYAFSIDENTKVISLIVHDDAEISASSLIGI